jgi:hypothetical protein
MVRQDSKKSCRTSPKGHHNQWNLMAALLVKRARHDLMDVFESVKAGREYTDGNNYILRIFGSRRSKTFGLTSADI